MANTPQSKKRARQLQKKTEIKKSRRSRIKTFIKLVEENVQKGDKKHAQEHCALAEPEIQRGVSKGILKKNTAARKISQLSGKIKALS
jgi:small subunit ribosomal protein S20